MTSNYIIACFSLIFWASPLGNKWISTSETVWVCLFFSLRKQTKTYGSEPLWSLGQRFAPREMWVPASWCEASRSQYVGSDADGACTRVTTAGYCSSHFWAGGAAGSRALLAPGHCCLCKHYQLDRRNPSREQIATEHHISRDLHEIIEMSGKGKSRENRGDPGGYNSRVRVYLLFGWWKNSKVICAYIKIHWMMCSTRMNYTVNGYRKFYLFNITVMTNPRNCICPLHPWNSLLTGLCTVLSVFTVHVPQDTVVLMQSTIGRMHTWLFHHYLIIPNKSEWNLWP